MNNFYVEYIFTKFVRVSSSVFFFSKSREIWFFHPPIYIDLYDCKIVCVLIESRYVERNNRKRILINKSHVHNFNFLEFYNFSVSVSCKIRKTSNLYVSSFFTTILRRRAKRLYIYIYLEFYVIFPQLFKHLTIFWSRICIIYILKFIRFSSVTIFSINYQSVWSWTEEKRLLKLLLSRNRWIIHREERSVVTNNNGQRMVFQKMM